MSDTEIQDDAYRIVINREQLRAALQEYVKIQGDSHLHGLSGEQQIVLFANFVARVLMWIHITEQELEWPERIWRCLVGIPKSRRIHGLPEVQISLNTAQVYFWGCEIGRLVVAGSVEPSFDPVTERALPQEMRDELEMEDVSEEYGTCG